MNTKDLVPLVALGFAGLIGWGLLNKQNTAQHDTKTDPVPSGYIDHTFNVGGAPPTVSTPGGFETIADANNVPILDVPSFQTLNRWAISVGLLSLNPNGFREPHWHPDANELLYCIKGNVVMTLFLGDPTVIHDSFVVREGEIVFVPKGFTHHVENIGQTEARLIQSWDNQHIQSVGLSSMVGDSPNSLMNQTFGSTFFNGFQGSTADVVIGLKPAGAPQPLIVSKPVQSFVVAPKSNITKFALQGTVGPVETVQSTSTYSRTQQLPVPIQRATAQSSSHVAPRNQTLLTSSYKFDLVNSLPAVNTRGGFAMKGFADNFPMLRGNGLAAFSIVLKPGGYREPHWHPNCAELHYVLTGKSRYMVASPGSPKIDTGDIGPDTFFYAPPGYLHFFGNSGTTNLHVVSFFTSENPQDVGLSGGLSAYNNSVLAGMFNLPANAFDLLPKFGQDKGIV